MRRGTLKDFTPFLFKKAYFKIPQWAGKRFPKGSRGSRNISEVEVGRNEHVLKDFPCKGGVYHFQHPIGQ